MPNLAVVGSGPAAFYTALRVAQKIPNIQIDMFEKLATPFGLTRFGVAPDHMEVKNCQERFSEVASNTDFRFYGNCEVGKDVSLVDLVRSFDAVLLAYGAQGERRLGIPGEQSYQGVLSARKFIGWYNGEPGCCQHLDIGSLLKRARHATIIGNGNVALDVARILLKKPDELKNTDITSSSLEALAQNNIEHVQIVGRRGVLQSAFTNKELRELQKMPGVMMKPVHPVSQLNAEASTRQDKRKLQLLKEPTGQGSTSGLTKSWNLSFLLSPKKFVGDEKGLQGVEWQVNELNGSQIQPTGRTEFQATDLVFTSIGYRSLPIAGLKDLNVEFNSQKGIVPRHGGRVVGGPDNLFASGWVATGPVGVIVSTMMDSFAVGDEIVNHIGALDKPRPGRSELHLPDRRIVNWEDWLRVDKEELARGQAVGKARSKFTSTEEILRWLD